jgi:hypothetical protein
MDSTKNAQAAHCHGPPALFWLSGNVASQNLAVVPQSGTKDQFYCTVKNITLN